jgi:hypothetical protein
VTKTIIHRISLFGNSFDEKRGKRVLTLNVYPCLRMNRELTTGASMLNPITGSHCSE